MILKATKKDVGLVYKFYYELIIGRNNVIGLNWLSNDYVKSMCKNKLGFSWEVYNLTQVKA